MVTRLACDSSGENRQSLMRIRIDINPNNTSGHIRVIKSSAIHLIAAEWPMRPNGHGSVHSAPSSHDCIVQAQWKAHVESTRFIWIFNGSPMESLVHRKPVINDLADLATPAWK